MRRARCGPGSWVEPAGHGQFFGPRWPIRRGLTVKQREKPRTSRRTSDDRSEGYPPKSMTAIIPAPTYILARAAWIPTLVIWHADRRFTQLEGEACGDYAAALAASWRRRRHDPARYDVSTRFGLVVLRAVRFWCP